MSNITSIWGTSEAEAWCRNFDYENYRWIHNQMSCEAKPFSEDGYKAICVVFEDEMIRDIG